MSKFTSSERRGAIVILAIIACITIYLAISKGVGLKAPESIPERNQPAATVDSASSTDDYIHKKKPKSKSTDKKAKKSGEKKTTTSSDNSKPRDPLSEPVSK